MQPQTLKQQPKPKTFLTNTLKVSYQGFLAGTEQLAHSQRTKTENLLVLLYQPSHGLKALYSTLHPKIVSKFDHRNETVLPKNPQNGCSKAGARGAQISYLHSIMLSIPLSLLLPHSPTLHTSGKKLFPVLFSLIRLSAIHVSFVVAYIIAAVGCSMLPLT